MKPLKGHIPEAYPVTLPWKRLVTTIAIGTTITDGDCQYCVLQRLISKVPGAEPRLLLKQIECTQTNPPCRSTKSAKDAA